MTGDDRAPMTTNGTSRPVPDPTVLTDQAIEKAVAALRDYIDGQFDVRDERLRGIDVATDLRLGQVSSTQSSISDDIERAVDKRSAVVDEKFHSVDQRFNERDTRSERESRDNKVAVDAAFAAQKEAAAKQDEANAKAIDKSERATAETIKTNLELTRSTSDALTKSLDEVKLEVRGISASKVGATENRTGLYATVGIIVSIMIAGMALITFAIARMP